MQYNDVERGNCYSFVFVHTPLWVRSLEQLRGCLAKVVDDAYACAPPDRVGDGIDVYGARVRHVMEHVQRIDRGLPCRCTPHALDDANAGTLNPVITSHCLPYRHVHLTR